MRKIVVAQELICPFNVCRLTVGDKEDNEMNIRCLTCEYIWNRKSKVIIDEGYLYLDENSKEYKEYEQLHTIVCVGCNS